MLNGGRILPIMLYDLRNWVQMFRGGIQIRFRACIAIEVGSEGGRDELSRGNGMVLFVSENGSG